MFPVFSHPTKARRAAERSHVMNAIRLPISALYVIAWPATTFGSIKRNALGETLPAGGLHAEIRAAKAESRHN